MYCEKSHHECRFLFFNPCKQIKLSLFTHVTRSAKPEGYLLAVAQVTLLVDTARTTIPRVCVMGNNQTVTASSSFFTRPKEASRTSGPFQARNLGYHRRQMRPGEKELDSYRTP